ncbi:MAG: FtsQ-type POTRA domain-containing protein [Coriobacteriia bacterium]|nr:FtsQ-type POTRA domain-containing protein [Coriobacteriia bacterium]
MARSKRLQREKRIAAQRTRINVNLILILAGVIGVILLIVGIYRSDLFSIQVVDVTGNTRLTADEVRGLAAVPQDATLLRFDGASVQERVEDSPWVAEAAVSREFPDTVRIRVDERVPFALVDAGGATYFVVDSIGHVLAEQTPDETVTVVVIRDVEDLELSVGSRAPSAALRNALAVWEGLGPELRARTRTISAPTVDRTTLITNEDIEIIIGSAEGVERKDTVARSILAEQAGSVVYINVRTVDRPTWRGLDAP